MSWSWQHASTRFFWKSGCCLGSPHGSVVLIRATPRWPQVVAPQIEVLTLGTRCLQHPLRQQMREQPCRIYLWRQSISRNPLTCRIEALTLGTQHLQSPLRQQTQERPRTRRIYPYHQLISRTSLPLRPSTRRITHRIIPQSWGPWI